MNNPIGSLFFARIPAYTHPNGHRAPATVVSIFGSVLKTNDAQPAKVRDLTQGEAKSALLARWPHLADVGGVELSKRQDACHHLFECDIVPSYSVPN
jgi:hypothetical protein